MVLCLPSAHIVSGFAEDGSRSQNVDAIDPRQVGPAHAKQFRSQVKLRLIAMLFLEPYFPLLFRQRRTVASILSLHEVLLELPITLADLLLAKLVAILFLLQHKQ